MTKSEFWGALDNVFEGSSLEERKVLLDTVGEYSRTIFKGLKYCPLCHSFSSENEFTYETRAKLCMGSTVSGRTCHTNYIMYGKCPKCGGSFIESLICSKDD